MIAPPDWASLSEFEQFALLVHAHDSQHRLMAMIVAYCDESGDHRPPSLFSVSAIIGPSVALFDLGSRWRKALDKHGLTATGFHMTECEAGAKDTPFEGMSRDQRDELQRSFIDVINKTTLSGFCSAIPVSTEWPKMKLLIGQG